MAPSHVDAKFLRGVHCTRTCDSSATLSSNLQGSLAVLVLSGFSNAISQSMGHQNKSRRGGPSVHSSAGWYTCATCTNYTKAVSNLIARVHAKHDAESETYLVRCRNWCTPELMGCPCTMVLQGYTRDRGRKARRLSYNLSAHLQRHLLHMDKMNSDIVTCQCNLKSKKPYEAMCRA